MIAVALREHRTACADGASFVGLEVATSSSDRLRASVHVTGQLLPATLPLLVTVLRTHLAGGRRHLRVDLAAARITDAEVIDALVETRLCIAGLGGTVVYDNAGRRLIDAIRDDRSGRWSATS